MNLLRFALIGLVVINLTGCNVKKLPTAYPNCNLESSYTAVANDLRQLADLKEVCGHLFSPDILHGCTGTPYLLSSEFHVKTCRDLNEEHNSIQSWLSAREPSIMRQCRAEPICLGWASATQGISGAPMLK